MFQGTCSNAGKSILTAALCRLLARSGISVAPFKAQNMSLNSAVTKLGEEIGRAQALQAYACGLEPDCRMNPILLKPTSDLGSQILVLGHPAGNLRTRDYQHKKKTLWPVVKDAYLSLANEHQIIVLEGAGSPAEINLRSDDIVNMRMAKLAQAKVILVADIDRGGAFAALAGTMHLLTRSERKLISGFILNKFRGDAQLLDPALKRITKLTQKPFLGIMPYIENIRLPDEDSVSFKQEANKTSDLSSNGSRLLKFDIIDLPHISNTTDFDALQAETDIQIRLIQHPDQLKHPLQHPHCLILPGTRNTGADLAYLENTGLLSAIKDYAAHCLNGFPGLLLGICGGFQMLGETILDPLGLEGKTINYGLNLLPFKTELTKDKVLQRCTGHSLSILTETETSVFGYEIHHGQTKFNDKSLVPVIEDPAGKPLAWGRLDQNSQIKIIGTYLHGLFDSDAFRSAFLNRLRALANLPQFRPVQTNTLEGLDRLADIFESAMPLPKLLQLLEIRL
ncbi:MAG: cobyric acid synthase [Desulfovibrionaceae bacterium]|nr:cobyric acid synthase [Desulfovibrionaceae bacterium]